MTQQSIIEEESKPTAGRKRGKRKAGAASSVAVNPETADIIDDLVRHLSEDFTVTRQQVVEKAVKHLRAALADVVKP